MVGKSRREQQVSSPCRFLGRSSTAAAMTFTNTKSCDNYEIQVPITYDSSASPYFSMTSHYMGSTPMTSTSTLFSQSWATQVRGFVTLSVGEGKISASFSKKCLLLLNLLLECCSHWYLHGYSTLTIHEQTCKHHTAKHLDSNSLPSDCRRQ
jgi:hypothetical protein